ncbi:DUF4262 domain-containing protein [Pseudoxanthomonas composti]|uniref:DUF4262 domain-containing protein n=1 Tax=Pseudoxanthomonas composti TaxID=2137479 RepID=A0A4V1N1A8_9GAMM|nr:DUF4262 domain-containing protein [Pseudoxanthomonas composti]RXR06999.1 DUF4262 domain-containing protein [Pseudoxanthomonas composti]
MNDHERKLLEHIEQYGFSTTSVFDPEGIDPTFSYTIGITRTTGAPELMVVGLSPQLGHALVSDYYDRVVQGEKFVPNTPYAGFLEGFPIQFAYVALDHRKRRMLSAMWLYEGANFEALQLIWPSVSGIWPWEAEASEQFRHQQPVLTM